MTTVLFHSEFSNAFESSFFLESLHVVSRNGVHVDFIPKLPSKLLRRVTRSVSGSLESVSVSDDLADSSW
jgi:hypothetical protein